MRRFGYSGWAALILGLAACEAQQSDNEVQQSANEAQKPAKKDQPAAKVAAARCPNLSTLLPVQTPDLTRKVYSCVERNALLYAKGPDSAEALSKAVMAKCKDTIVQYVDQEAKKAGVRPPYKEAFESWQAHTLPIIAEARARGCYG
jgi:hypothetical protein